MLTVSDDQILDAMCRLIRELRVIVEPAGAAGLAAVLAASTGAGDAALIAPAGDAAVLASAGMAGALSATGAGAAGAFGAACDACDARAFAASAAGEPFRGRRVGILLSGGNASAQRVREVLAAALPAPPSRRPEARVQQVAL
jgi:threonine dehydratase